MPLVPAKCTNCGASLQIDDAQQAAVCPYCHAAYVVEQAINIFVNDVSSIDARVENANTFLEKIHDYKKAREIYESITNDKSSDYRGWWGLVRVDTREFKKTGDTHDRFKAIQKNAAHALKVAPPEIRASLETEWNAYVEKVKSHVELKIQEQEVFQQQLEKERALRSKLENQLAELERGKNSIMQKRQTITQCNCLIIMVIICCGIFGLMLIMSGIVSNNGASALLGFGIVAFMIFWIWLQNHILGKIAQQLAQIENNCKIMQQEFADTDAKIQRLNWNVREFQKYIF